MLLDRLSQMLECQRLSPPESEWPERVFEILQGRLRESHPRGETLDEPCVGPRDPGRGCPLQQHFRHNDLVRRPARFAPGEGAAVSREPGEEPPAQPGNTLGRLGRDLMWSANWPSHQAHSLSRQEATSLSWREALPVSRFDAWAEGLCHA